MLGEGQVPQLALSWELYSVALAPPGEMVGGVLCETVDDMVFHRFGVILKVQLSLGGFGNS